MFRFLHPFARQVCVVGDFNHWRIGAFPMVPGADGWWTASSSLSPGRHEFRYWADGEWFTDFAAFGVEPRETGFVSVLWLEPEIGDVACPRCGQTFPECRDRRVSHGLFATGSTP